MAQLQFRPYTICLVECQLIIRIHGNPSVVQYVLYNIMILLLSRDLHIRMRDVVGRQRVGNGCVLWSSKVCVRACVRVSVSKPPRGLPSNALVARVIGNRDCSVRVYLTGRSVKTRPTDATHRPDNDTGLPLT